MPVVRVKKKCPRCALDCTGQLAVWDGMHLEFPEKSLMCVTTCVSVEDGNLERLSAEESVAVRNFWAISGKVV